MCQMSHRFSPSLHKHSYTLFKALQRLKANYVISCCNV